MESPLERGGMRLVARRRDAQQSVLPRARAELSDHRVGMYTNLSEPGLLPSTAIMGLSLDRTDNDPVAFVASVLAAVDPILQLGGAIADSLEVAAPPIEDVVLPELVDACSASQQPFVFVLDDVHLVTETRCHKIIDYLSQRLPSGCQLTLATRTDPALPFATLRAHGRLVEVRAADLALNKSEAAALLGAAGARLNDDQVEMLIDRTEGWPAALYLAALSLRDRSNPGGFVDRFAGTSRHVADFLSEDVLARQPDNVIASDLHP